MSNRIACIGSKNFVLITSLRALITSSAFQDSVGRSLTQSRRSVPYWQVPRHWQVDDYWPWNDRNARGATVTFSSAVFSSRGNLQKVIATRSPLQCQWRSQGLQSWCMIQTTFLTSDVVTGTTLLRGKLRKASHLWVVVSHASHGDDLRSRILQIVLILLGVAVACSRPVTVGIRSGGWSFEELLYIDTGRSSWCDTVHSGCAAVYYLYCHTWTWNFCLRNEHPKIPTTCLFHDSMDSVKIAGSGPRPSMLYSIDLLFLATQAARNVDTSWCRSVKFLNFQPGSKFRTRNRSHWVLLSSASRFQQNPCRFQKTYKIFWMDTQVLLTILQPEKTSNFTPTIFVAYQTIKLSRKSTNGC